MTPVEALVCLNANRHAGRAWVYLPTSELFATMAEDGAEDRTLTLWEAEAVATRYAVKSDERCFSIQVGSWLNHVGVDYEGDAYEWLHRTFRLNSGGGRSVSALALRGLLHALGWRFWHEAEASRPRDLVAWEWEPCLFDLDETGAVPVDRIEELASALELGDLDLIHDPESVQALAYCLRDLLRSRNHDPEGNEHDERIATNEV